MPRNKIFFGWWVLSSAGLTTICCGAIIYGIPAYYPTLISHFGWSRAAITFGFFLAFIANSVAQMLVGWAIDRQGARKVLILGTAFSGLAYMGFGSVNSLTTYYVFCILLGIGWAGMAYVPNSALVCRWFVRRRGTALGLVTAVAAVGGAVAAPLITFLVLRTGWRATYVLVGAACMLLPLIPLAVVVRETPQSMGLQPDGAEGAAPAVSAAAKRKDNDLSFFAAIRNTSALAIFAGLLCTGLFIGAINQHLILYLRGEGFTPYFAASMLSLEMIFGLAGRLAFGYVADRVSIRFATVTFFLLLAVSTLLVFSVNMWGGVYLFVLCHGLGHGGLTAFTPVVFSTLFPEKHMGKNIALGFTIYTVGVGSGPALNGYLFDISGSYFYAFVLNAIVVTFATIVTLGFGITGKKAAPAPATDRSDGNEVPVGSTRKIGLK